MAKRGNRKGNRKRPACLCARSVATRAESAARLRRSAASSPRSSAVARDRGERYAAGSRPKSIRFRRARPDGVSNSLSKGLRPMSSCAPVIWSGQSIFGYQAVARISSGRIVQIGVPKRDSAASLRPMPSRSRFAAPGCGSELALPNSLAGWVATRGAGRQSRSRCSARLEKRNMKSWRRRHAPGSRCRLRRRQWRQPGGGRGQQCSARADFGAERRLDPDDRGDGRGRLPYGQSECAGEAGRIWLAHLSPLRGIRGARQRTAQERLCEERPGQLGIRYLLFPSTGVRDAPLPGPETFFISTTSYTRTTDGRAASTVPAGSGADENFRRSSGRGACGGRASTSLPPRGMREAKGTRAGDSAGEGCGDHRAATRKESRTHLLINAESRRCALRRSSPLRSEYRDEESAIVARDARAAGSAGRRHSRAGGAARDWTRTIVAKRRGGFRWATRAR